MEGWLVLWGPGGKLDNRMGQNRRRARLEGGPSSGEGGGRNVTGQAWRDGRNSGLAWGRGSLGWASFSPQKTYLEGWLIRPLWAHPDSPPSAFV
jgi:hypothetical protein